MKSHQVRREQVALITSAAEPQSKGFGERERRYAISMSIRTVCFLGAVLADGWLRWVLLVGAVILPYTSVVLANAGVRLRRGSGENFVPMNRDELGGSAPREL